MELNSFSFPVSMVKSGDEKDNRIPIEIIPNRPTFDRVNDKILLKAFDQECRKSFIHQGIIDYDHKSLLGETEEERATAIIGEPEDLFVDEKRGIPVCKAFLFKGNPYVDNAIMPALKARSKVFGGSLGGKILLKSTDVDPITKKKKNTISKISLAHIAVTPLQKAVHQGTSVTLRKSMDENDPDIEIQFSGYDDFIKSFSDCEVLEKALQAGAETNVANISGGQAIQKQSLEGTKKIKVAMPFILSDIVNGIVKGKSEDYKLYLISRGFTASEADETIKLLAQNGASIVKLNF